MFKDFFKPRYTLTEKQLTEIFEEVEKQLREEIYLEVEKQLNKDYQDKLNYLQRKLDETRADYRMLSNRFIKLQQEHDILKGQSKQAEKKKPKKEVDKSLIDDLFGSDD